MAAKIPASKEWLRRETTELTVALLAFVREMFREDPDIRTMRVAVIVKHIGCDLLDSIPKLNELCFTLGGRRAAPSSQLIHRDAGDLARDSPYIGP
jgi:hypothetical protein